MICSQFERPKREMFKKTSFGQNLSKIYRTSIEHQWDIYRCLSMPMHSHGCLWMSTDIRRKSKITDLASIGNRNSNYSTFFFLPCSGPTVADNNVFGCIFLFFFSLGFGGQQRVTCYLWSDPSHLLLQEVIFVSKCPVIQVDTTP